MTYAKNLVSINKAIVDAWENMVAKGAGLAYDVRKGNIDFKHLTNDEFQREYGNYQDFITKEQLENSQKGSVVL